MNPEEAPVSVEEAIAESLTPYFTDDSDKTRYLSYRASGFTVLESCKLIDIHPRTVSRWRDKDERFNHYDTSGLSQLRKDLAATFTYAEFTRNFRLVLEKDFQVLSKAATKQDLSPDEKDYLHKIRGFYTPQQLQAIRQILMPQDSNQNGPLPANFNFTQFVMNISKGNAQPIEVIDIPPSKGQLGKGKGRK